MRHRQERFLDAERRFQQKFLRSMSDPTLKRLGRDPSDHPHVRFLIDAVARSCAGVRARYEVSQGRFARNCQEVHAPNSTAPVPGFALLSCPDRRSVRPAARVSIGSGTWRAVPYYHRRPAAG